MWASTAFKTKNHVCISKKTLFWLAVGEQDWWNTLQLSSKGYYFLVMSSNTLFLGYIVYITSTFYIYCTVQASDLSQIHSSVLLNMQSELWGTVFRDKKNKEFWIWWYNTHGTLISASWSKSGITWREKRGDQIHKRTVTSSLRWSVG